MEGFAGTVDDAADVSVAFGGVPAASHTLTSTHGGYVLLQAVAPLSSVAKSVALVVTSTVDTTVSATAPKLYNYLSSNGAEIVSIQPTVGSTRGGSLISVRLAGTTYSTAITATFTLPTGVTASGTVVDMVGDDLVVIKAPASPAFEAGLASVALVVGSAAVTFGFTFESPITTPAIVEVVQPHQVAVG
jgi:hypothetical protein